MTQATQIEIAQLYFINITYLKLIFFIFFLNILYLIIILFIPHNINVILR